MAHVASQKRSLTIVNAAFLQEVKESNPQLWSTIRDLRSISGCEEDSRRASLAFVRGLGELRDLLALQFSLEETYGYLQGSPGLRSDLRHTDAAQAKRQHSELYLQLHELCEQAEEAQYRGTIGRDLAIYVGGFEVFDHCFQAHEELESELIRGGFGMHANH